MSVLLVGYDLNSPGQSYAGLIQALERYTHCHALDSMWFIDTSTAPADVRKKLERHIDSNDQLYVMKLRRHWAANRKDICTEWLKSPSRTWD